jgi:hypothetical protein
MTLCLITLAGAIVKRSSDQKRARQAQLEGLLEKAGRYCERLNRVSLYFVCTEEIEEKIFNPYRILEWGTGWKTDKNNYVYDYQLIRKDNTIEETRILLRENGKSINMKDAPLKTRRFWYQHVIFGPVGIFSFEAQDTHDYSIEKEAKLWGRQAILVRAIPKNPNEEKWLYGRAWLDAADASILKTEWEEKSVKNYDAMQKFAKTIDARPGLKQEAEYGFEKNRVRFPSQFRVIEDYYQRRSLGIGVRVITKSDLIVRYKNYKFFTVETETDIKR